MSEKKVIAVIVEGPSDENAIGGILKEFFSSEEVQFAVVHGDITSNDLTTVDNVITKIDKLIDGIRTKYGYCWDDFVKVIHIADTDGAFTKNNVKESEVEGIQYFEDHIAGANVEAIERRNKHKAEILFKLYSTGKVHGIGYRIYFNSCNLEHVLYGTLQNFSDEEKEEMADDFAEKYEGRVDDFISFISDEIVAVPGTYKATWRFIEKEKHSLERHSNMHLIFTK
ncbi:MAG: Hsp33 family molecular chaperone HslO [Lachnospiraceae bacterium]|nr:Hsp33 family molecular chaperone HslO [Lachnospiraceae bacterium]